MPAPRFYDEDLAAIHHEGFAELAREGGRELLSLLAREGVGSGRVVDLGCGSGVWPARLLAAGFSVTVGDRYGAYPLAPRRSAFFARRLP